MKDSDSCNWKRFGTAVEKKGEKSQDIMKLNTIFVTVAS